MKKLRYSSLVGDGNVFCTWNNTHLTIHDLSDNDSIGTFEVDISNGHKLDSYFYSERSGLLVRDNYGRGGISIYQLVKDGAERDLTSTEIEMNYFNSPLDHAQYLLYRTERSQPSEKPRSIIYLLDKQNFMQDSIVVDSRIYSGFQQVGDYLYGCIEDTVFKIGLTTLNCEIIPRAGVNGYTNIYSDEGYLYSYYAPSLEEGEFWLTYKNKSGVLDTLWAYTPFKNFSSWFGEDGGLNRFERIFFESKYTPRIRPAGINGGFFGMGRSDGDFLGKVVVVNMKGELQEEYDFSDAIGKTGIQMELVSISDNIEHFLLRKNETYYLANRDFDPYFKFKDNPRRFIHDKYILTSHRLLNQYELFPINGYVAIEMVREQSRLGEVREFTQEELEKYGLN